MHGIFAEHFVPVELTLVPFKEQTVVVEKNVNNFFYILLSKLMRHFLLYGCFVMATNISTFPLEQEQAMSFPAVKPQSLHLLY